MLSVIESLFTPAEAAGFSKALASAPWQDGAATAGGLAARIKTNEQADDRDPEVRRLSDTIVQRLGQHAVFTSAALPRRLFPPKFNRYRNGGYYGTHVDNAIMHHRDDGTLIRTDLSATLFLSDPDDYDGGELVIEGEYGAQAIRLAAGDLVLYPSTSLHQVTPVTRGARVAAFFWITSLVPDATRRAMLFDLDQSIQALSLLEAAPVAAEVARLAALYHNLVRQWSEV